MNLPGGVLLINRYYTFSLTMTNFLGVESTVEFGFEVKPTVPPTVKIDGPSS